jgi:hypothetical protein
VIANGAEYHTVIQSSASSLSLMKQSAGRGLTLDSTDFKRLVPGAILLEISSAVP